MADDTSFFSSLRAGLKGMLRGGFALGVAGIAVGTLIGLTGGTVVASAATFALLGGAVGSFLGAITGIVQQNRQTEIDPQDLINMNNMSFAHGVEAGRDQNVSHAATCELKEAASHFQNKLASERSNPQQQR